MLNWIKSLLGYTDRATSAAGRVAAAWEDVAAMSEAVRDEMRTRLGFDPKALPAPVDADEPARKRR